LAMLTLRRSIWFLVVSVAFATAACKKKTEAPATTGSAGSADMTGSAGSADMTGSAGSAGSADAAGSAGSAGTAGSAAAPAGPPATGVAEIKPTKGNKVSGTVTFNEKDGKTEVVVDLKGLTPGEHGFHVHETGDCSAPDAKSAGDHFNPDKAEHGAPDAAAHHTGDLGNVTADKSGAAKVTTTVDFLTVNAGPHSVVGKAVIVHCNADDLKSQPAGNAGPRVGCGVVVVGGSEGEKKK
jgi:superoxide dismutase, Cu-Zn family